jgi:predicted heme/steroid binding protein
MRKNVYVSSIVTIFIIGGALFIRLSKQQANQNNENALQPISLSTFSEANGKQGAACWLAVDGIVYEIEQGYKWQEGQHTESSSAYCGADMSTTIDSAPHGRTKLSQLKKIGTLAK